MCDCDETATGTRYFFKSLYLRAFVSIISFSKSFRSDLKTFLDGTPVLSVISWRVSSPPSFKASTTSWSFLFSFTMVSIPLAVCYGFLGFFNFAVAHPKNKGAPLAVADLMYILVFRKLDDEFCSFSFFAFKGYGAF